jgi:hypothetical protein
MSYRAIVIDPRLGSVAETTLPTGRPTASRRCK